MFLILGGGGKTKDLGPGFAIECPNCHNSSYWRVLNTSNRATVFFVPVAKWKSRYWLACPICTAALQLESKEQAERILAAALLDDTEARDDLLCQVMANQ